MTKKRTTAMLPAGIHLIVPFEADGRRGSFACSDPDEAINRDGDSYGVEIRRTGHHSPSIAVLDGETRRLVVTLDIDEDVHEGISFGTPLGPLTVARQYLVTPAERVSANANPGEQYATNWVAIELAAETEMSVEGAAITIGDTVIDLAALPPVETSSYHLDGREADWGAIVAARRTSDAEIRRHVAQPGDPVHAILSEGARHYDDGVIIMIDVTPEQTARMEALEGDAAGAYARQMRSQIDHGRHHIVVRPALG